LGAMCVWVCVANESWLWLCKGDWQGEGLWMSRCSRSALT
jgi:hypothetical protein